MNDPNTIQTVKIKVGKRLTTRLGNETILLDLENGIYFELNEAGSIIWTLLESSPDKSYSVRNLCELIMSEFDVDRNQCENDLRTLVMDMKKNDLVTIV